MKTFSETESTTSLSPRLPWTARLFQVALLTPMLAFLACASTGSAAAQAAEEDTGLLVTVMIYSGRPNPSFTIEDEALIDELRNAVATAGSQEDFEGRTVVPSILGYNGVRVENRGGIAGLPRVLLLYGGTMEIRNGGVRFVADPGRGVERGLIQQGTERGIFRQDDRALGMIREALAGGNGSQS